MADKFHSSDSEDQTNRRKRSKKSGSEESGSTKKRGRPRVDTQDATAADRRRTQIRLAQRAYRQRKETTISSLKRRVVDLESTVEQMNQAFLKFNDSAISSGIFTLRPELAKELKATTEVFVKIAREAAMNAEPGEDEDADIEEVVSETVVAKPPPQLSNISLPSRMSFAQPEQDHLDMGFGFSRMFQGREAELQQRDTISSFLSGLPNEPPEAQHVQHNSHDLLPFGLVTHNSDIPYHVNPVTVPPTPPNAISALREGLSSPFTYSFQETSFARRLQRYALERGFHVLSSKGFQPSKCEKVFRLSLLTTTPEQLLARFRALLTKSDVESLEFWQSPFIHLGGAGTHYPRRDRDGNIIPIPNGWTVRKIGPLPSTQAMLMDSTGNLQDIEVDLKGYEGNWFDAHDVAGYLEEKGCRIDPQSSFAEALIDLYPAPNVHDISAPLAMDLGMENTVASTQLGSKRRASPYTSIDGAASLTSSGGTYSSVDSTPPTPNNMNESGDIPFDFGDIGDGQQAGLAENNMFDDGFFDMSFPMKPNHKKRSVTIDVNKLCDELVSRAVCLGRAPGFRPHDVDAAFDAAIISAF